MKRILCTMLALCLLAAGVPALALTADEALGLTQGDSSQYDSYVTLQRGATDGADAGAYVVRLQNRLRELGYLLSAADGTFGSMTESAVINFQVENGLTPTGIADSTTQSVLYSDAAVRAPAQQMEDNDIFLVQTCLARWGFLDSAPDGVMGDVTSSAILAFKNYVTGNPLYEAYASPTPEPVATMAPEQSVAPGEQPVAMDEPLPPSSGSLAQNSEITEYLLNFMNGTYPFQVFQMVVQRGSSGTEVWRVQRRLHQLKYLYKPDGSFGSLTESALKYFQRKNGLPETGIADQATQEKLFSVEALQSEEYVFPYKIRVSLSEQRVYIYSWQGDGYTKEVGSSVCSTGRPGYETPKGVYQSGGKCTIDEWYYFLEYGVYAKYATRIVGGVLFHSVLYDSNKKGPTQASISALGQPVSHGCVRLPEANAKWIFENCAEGTTIEIY